MSKHYNRNSSEFLDFELGDPIKEFVPSQFYDTDRMYLTIPLNIKGKGVKYYVIDSMKFVQELETIKEQASYSLTRIPSFEQRWSNESIQMFRSGDVSADYPQALSRTISLLKEYLDLGDENWYLVVALWLWSTYFYRLFNSFPYFNINGLMASGKSKLLDIGSRLAFNGEFLVNSTASYITSSIHDNGATLFLDEVENLKGQSGNIDVQTLIQLLNSGYKKGSMRGKKDISGNKKSWSSVKLDPYSPKMIAGINNISNTLISRSINMTMLASSNHLTKNKELQANNPILQELRDIFYISSLELAESIKDIAEGLTDSDISGRDWEVWRPLFCLAVALGNEKGEDPDSVYNQVRTFALTILDRQKDFNVENQSAIQMLLAFKELLDSDACDEKLYPIWQLRKYLMANYGYSFDWLSGVKESGSTRFIGDTLRKTGVISEPAKPVRFEDKVYRCLTLNKSIIVSRLRAYGVEN